MKILTVNHSDSNGGAARAAYRIHRALRQFGVESVMQVNQVGLGDWTVLGPSGKLANNLAMLRPYLGALANHLLKIDKLTFRSPALLPSNWAKKFNDSLYDLVHLHWINNEMMSIRDVGRINKPVVWTLHDMWAFCGTEHYTEDLRWRDGYMFNNRPSYESGFDLNRWTWQRKRKYWHHPRHIVTPSQWLADCVKQSALMFDWPVTVIPNAIDTEVWQPIEKQLARQLMGLPSDVPLLLFGAMGGGNDARKGLDQLRAALNHLRGQMNDLHLLILGQMAPREQDDLGFKVHYTGHLYDDLSLRLLYSAADLLIIPSRQDNLPNTGVESLACGTPVVAFDTCGVPDIVEHKSNGYLAPAFDTEELAQGIQWVLKDPKRYETLSENARSYALARFSYPVVAGQYLKLYQDLTV